MIYPVWIALSLAVSLWLVSFVHPFFYGIVEIFAPESEQGGIAWAVVYAVLAALPFPFLYMAGMWIGRNVLHVFHSPFSPIERWFDGLVSYLLLYVTLGLPVFWLVSKWFVAGMQDAAWKQGETPKAAEALAQEFFTAASGEAIGWLCIAVAITAFLAVKSQRGLLYLWAIITAPLRSALQMGRFSMGGSARFAGFLSEWTKAFWYNDDKLLLGKSFYGGLYVGLKLDRHFLTIGGSRGGKGVSAIIPNLNCWSENIFCIDPKGENATIMARPLNAKVLDPYGIVQNDQVQRCGYNFLADIDAHSPDVVSQINTMLEAIIIATSDKDPFWDNVSKTLFTGFLAHVLTHPDFEGRRDLVSVYELCYVTGERQKRLIDNMADNPGCYGLAQKGAAVLQIRSENTEAGILTTLRTHLDFLKDPRIQKAVSGPNAFSIYDLATDWLKIFVCLPVDDIKTQKPWLRLMLMWCFRAMTRPPKGRKTKLLFIMDEFHKLGWLPVIEEAAGLVAGYGIRLWPIVQEIGQLRKLYGDTWETFVSNAAGVQFLAVSDLETLEYIAKRLGRSSHKRETLGGQQSGPLVEYDEIEKILEPGKQRMIVKPSGGDALVLKQCPYFKHMSARYYDAPPEHRGGTRKVETDWSEQGLDKSLEIASGRYDFRWIFKEGLSIAGMVIIMYMLPFILLWYLGKGVLYLLGKLFGRRAESPAEQLAYLEHLADLISSERVPGALHAKAEPGTNDIRQVDECLSDLASLQLSTEEEEDRRTYLRMKFLFAKYKFQELLEAHGVHGPEVARKTWRQIESERQRQEALQRQREQAEAQQRAQQEAAEPPEEIEAREYKREEENAPADATGARTGRADVINLDEARKRREEAPEPENVDGRKEATRHSRRTMELSLALRLYGFDENGYTSADVDRRGLELAKAGVDHNLIFEAAAVLRDALNR